MSKKYEELKKSTLKNKEEELLVLKLTKDYLKERIDNFGEEERQQNLDGIEKSIEEVKKQIKFFKK